MKFSIAINNLQIVMEKRFYNIVKLGIKDLCVSLVIIRIIILELTHKLAQNVKFGKFKLLIF